MTGLVGYSIAEFSADVLRILDTSGETAEAVWEIGPLLQRLAAEQGELERPHQPGDEGARPRRGPLYADPDGHFVLQLATFGPDHVTPVHSHQGWGVFYLLTGYDQYTSWRRLDPGAEPGRAELEVVQQHHLEPGDLAYWFNEPYNVHQQRAGSQGCTELVLHKAQGRRVLHFEPRQRAGAWRAVQPPPREG